MIVLGIGEYGATNKPDEVIKTLALGSCVALIMLDPKTKTIGMAHVALPESSINKKLSEKKPGHFADTAVPALLKKMYRYTNNDRAKGYIIKLTGGANIMDNNNVFNIGTRNVLSLKKTLWKYRLGAIAEDVGKRISRTVRIDSTEGKVIITSPGRGQWEL